MPILPILYSLITVPILTEELFYFNVQCLIQEVSIMKSYLCYNLECTYEISDNGFANNSAIRSGGAIYYDLYRPRNLTNNNFEMNSA